MRQPPYAPPRYLNWLPATDRRIRCECGNFVSPDGRQLDGRAVFVCRGSAGRPCGIQLLIFRMRGSKKYLVAQVSEADLEAMESLDPLLQFAYLHSEPMRQRSA